MSRLSNLLRQVEAKDPQLAADLKREVDALSARRAFGLNFERHIPETVELPGRPIRRGDKVRFLPKRGEKPGGVDKRLWRVVRIHRTEAGRVADLIPTQDAEAMPEAVSRAVEDLVVVAEFRDPIYPGLVSTGRIERGGDKPFHTVINAENYHALQALLYTHEGKVDAIYIDPPYNTGARDWKYNNDYVDADDAYRHSKWLAMMERRLHLARRLLRLDNSVLIVTIDNNEVHRLGLLIDQLFPEARVQFVSSVINPRGRYREGEFAVSDEYLLIVMFGTARVLGEPDEDFAAGDKVSWRTLRRSDIESRRGTPKGGTSQFYPLFVDPATNRIAGVGDPLSPDDDRALAPTRKGCVSVFPVRDDGTEMNWGLTPESFRDLLARGFIRLGDATPGKPQQYQVSYLTSGRVADIESGRAVVVGYEPSGAVVAEYVTHKLRMPTTNWSRPSHNAEVGGTNLLKALLGEKRFDYPKSLYAVEDVLRYFVQDKPHALVVDFFAGSGTTAHAIMRLNKQDGGRRQSLLVTNNEVSPEAAARLEARGQRPGAPGFESAGVSEFITKPRIRAAVTGSSPSGQPVVGSYKFTDEFPMSVGFEENVEFFTITYEAPRPVAHHRAFGAIAPLLWLKAGARGRRIQEAAPDFDVADAYGVLFDLDASREFLAAIGKTPSVRMAFIVTDDDRGFQAVCAELPARVEAVRLYESYLTNFVINTGRE